MKSKKAKEQLIAITILSSVFIFFIYLKMNPEMNVNSNNQNIILKFEDDKKYILQIISLKSGELLKQIHINK